MTSGLSTKTRPSSGQGALRPGLVGLLAHAFERRLERQPQIAEIDRLATLSDPELAAMGLRRGGIAGKVLGNRFCY